MRAIDFLSRNIRPLILLLGFASSLTGTLGSFLLIDNLDAQPKQATDRRDGDSQEIDKLGTLAANYFIANQQGDLIYALSLQESSRQDLLALIYKGNLLDRAEPTRNLIAAESLSGLSDYTKTYGDYERLNDIARGSGTFEDYVAVKDYERNVVQLAQKRVQYLQLRLVPETQQINNLNRRLSNRRQSMIIFASAGAFLLLLANLMEHRRSLAHTEAPPRAAAADPKLE